MIPGFFFCLWLAVSVWAAFIVSRRIENRGDRIAYFLVIWLIPYFGAAAAAFLTRDRKPETSSSEKMFSEVVAAHEGAIKKHDRP